VGRGRRRPLALWVIATLALCALAVVLIGYRNATADPLVRRLVVTVPDYPPGAAPVRLLLFSDVHVHGPDMPPSRLERIVRQMNALDPDVVLGAGDFIGDTLIGKEYSPTDAVAPLAGLKAKFGVYAVTGNQTSSANLSSQLSALRPLTWAHPVSPGRTSWRRICSGL
jgi:predicted MPP superfamily phosphohydrolase